MKREVWIHFKKYYINGEFRIILKIGNLVDINMNLYGKWNDFIYKLYIDDLNTSNHKEILRHISQFKVGDIILYNEREYELISIDGYVGIFKNESGQRKISILNLDKKNIINS